MQGKPFPGTRRWWTATVLLLAALGPINVARGQSDTAPTPAMHPAVADDGVKQIPTIPTDDGVVQAGCGTCGGGLIGGGGCVGCGAGQCYPGRRPCDCCCDSDTVLGRFVNGIYQCVCCPDPCYDPHWLAIADASYFVDAARPITQMRLRVDQMWDMNSPDRAEYFWAKLGGKGPSTPVRRIDVSEVKLYTEAAAGRAGIGIEVPYRHIEKDFDSSGFADMSILTKAMLLDCELIQITFGFKTTIPIAAANKGLGTLNVGLEPSLIWAIRLTPTTYLQAQTALWIPVGGTPSFEGNIFIYRFSLNQILYKPCNDWQLIGTLELDGWSILSGERTDASGQIGDAKGNLVSAGPGIRFVLCDRIDWGIGTLFSFTNQHWAEEMLRFEFRWRF
jgi:hypothetical protein